MTRLHDLETPRLLLDEARMHANIGRTRARLDSLGVRLWPHVKTAKCIESARPAVASPRGPITVSKLEKAEYFFARGVEDILYAVAITPNKLDHVVDLRRRCARGARPDRDRPRPGRRRREARRDDDARRRLVPLPFDRHRVVRGGAVAATWTRLNGW